MARQRAREIEHQVQEVDRQHPDWSARQVELELESVAPIAYGDWREGTPNLASRLRQVQRWRRGGQGGAGPTAHPLFPYLWPMGEQQRQGLEPEFKAHPTIARGSNRLFLYNCSPEAVRDVRVRLDGHELSYEPAVPSGRFAEIHWRRSESVRESAIRGAGGPVRRHRLSVEFVMSKGTRRGRLDGELELDSENGWVGFSSRDGRRKEIE